MEEKYCGTMPRKAVVAALGVVALASSLLASPAPAKVELEVPMLAHDGYFSERCFELSAAKLRFALESPHAVDFNFHYHVGDKTEFPIRAEVSGHYTGELALVAAGEYCFMWKNRGDQPDPYTIRLSYDLS